MEQPQPAMLFETSELFLRSVRARILWLRLVPDVLMLQGISQ